MNRKKEDIDSLHSKAIRLLEGGVVSVQGLSVKVVVDNYLFDPCFVCEMDSLCHYGTDIHLLCRECDIISRKDCFLVLVGK